MWTQEAALNSTRAYRIDNSTPLLVSGSPLVAFGYPTTRLSAYVPTDGSLSEVFEHAREFFSYIKAEAMVPSRARASDHTTTPSSGAGGAIRVIFSNGVDAEPLRDNAATGATGPLFTSHAYPAGLSGGPVVNLDGDLVGIVQGRMDSASQGLVISRETIRRALDIVIRRAAGGATHGSADDVFKCKARQL